MENSLGRVKNKSHWTKNINSREGKEGTYVECNIVVGSVGKGQNHRWEGNV